MRDLETQITTWRRDLRAAGFKSPDLLEELEGHLRDDIEQQMQSGTDMQQAFSVASRRIGPARELRNEFQKVQSTMLMKLTPAHRRWLTEVLVVIALIAIQVALLLPIVEKVKHQQALTAFDIAAIFALSATYLGFIVYFVRKRFQKA